MDAIGSYFSSYVSFDFKDDNVIFGACFLLTRLIVWTVAKALFIQGSAVKAVCVKLIVFLHLKAIVAKAFCSSFHYVYSRSLAVPVPLIDLGRSHVEEPSHFSDFKTGPERVSLEFTC